VTAIDAYAFTEVALTNIVIPDNVTNIENGAFLRCQNLTSVVIGNGVISIGDNAFESCDSLTSLTIPGNVASIGDSTFLRRRRGASCCCCHCLQSLGFRILCRLDRC